MNSALFFVAVIIAVSSVVCNKICTNSGMNSHTLRHQLLSLKDKNLNEQEFHHFHLTPTDDSTWQSLFPRKMLKEEDQHSWILMYRKMKNSGAGDRDFLSEVSLHDVGLDPTSLHGEAQQTNLEYLLMLDVDRLVWSFRNTAGLDTPGEPYGGWESPTEELRGHFVGWPPPPSLSTPPSLSLISNYIY